MIAADVVSTKTIKIIQPEWKEMTQREKFKSSVAGNRTRIWQVRAAYPNRLDYNGLLVLQLYLKI